MLTLPDSVPAATALDGADGLTVVESPFKASPSSISDHRTNFKEYKGWELWPFPRAEQ